MVDEWRGMTIAAHDRYLLGAENYTTRRRLILAMMEKRGNIKKGFDGALQTTYDVEMRDAPVTSDADGTQWDFNRRDYLDQASFDWRNMKATDMVTKGEMVKLKGSNQLIVNRFARIFPKLDESLRKALDQSFYNDGFATGYENKFCGIESLMGYDASKSLVGDILAYPTDTYNGISTQAGRFGSWSTDMTTKPNASIATDWPFGNSLTPEYDYWTPQLWNWSSNAWGTSAVTWGANCQRCIRRAISTQRMINGDENATIVGVLDNNLMLGFKDAFDANKYIFVPHKESQDLGFSDVLNFEGAALEASFGVPGNTGYIFSIDYVELLILTDKLFEREGPDTEPLTKSELMAEYTYGNWRFWPKRCAKLFNYKAS